jgi:peptide/nickel transport system ATP-binding protein
MITADDLVKHYFQSKSGTGFTAIDGVNLTIAKGERVGIVGSTGCGKSTFLRIVTSITMISEGIWRLFSKRTGFYHGERL